MIAIDSSELKIGSTMPDVEGLVAVDGLEKMTGADLLVSPIDMPAKKPAQIAEHIDNKAILVQMKRGLDLASSIGERLNFSLLKMREVAPRQSQRVLLFVGTLNCGKDDRAVIDGRDVAENIPGVNYWACQTSLDAWSERGGSVVQLSRLSLVGDWLKRKEERLKKYLESPTVFIYPDKPDLLEADLDGSSDPLQIPVKVNDWRIPMAWLIGPKKTQLLAEAVKGHGGMAFMHLSNPDDWEYLPKGIYKSDAEKFRAKMGLKPGETINVKRLTVTDDY